MKNTLKLKLKVCSNLLVTKNKSKAFKRNEEEMKGSCRFCHIRSSRCGLHHRVRPDGPDGPDGPTGARGARDQAPRPCGAWGGWGWRRVCGCCST